MQAHLRGVGTEVDQAGFGRRPRRGSAGSASSPTRTFDDPFPIASGVVIQPGHYDFTSFRASIRLWSLSRRLTFPYPEARKIMIKSKLTSKSQTTIPQPVRLALGLEPGDEVVYEIEEGRVVVRKAGAVAVDDPFATFNEWSGTADREAYGDL